MSAVAARLTAIRPSPTVAMTRRAGELKASGKPVITLSQGEPDFATPASICEAGIQAIQDGFTKYTNVDGMPALKQAIAEKFRHDNGLDYALNQITVSSGAKIILYNTLLATIDPGDEVIIPVPYWVSYPDMVRLVGGEPVFLDCPADNGFIPTAEALAAAITPRTKMLILNSPNNPTGAVYDRESQLALAALLRDHPQVLILTDELYEYLVYDNAHHQSFGALAPDLMERTITVNGMSKGYAMTGWRLGYAGGPVDIIRAVNTLAGQNVNAPSSISQRAGVAALTGPQGFLAEHRELFRARRDATVAGLNRIAGIHCATPGGAFYVFADVSGCLAKTSPGGKRLDDDTGLVMALLEEALVAAVPGSAFGKPGFMRLSYALSLEEMDVALGRIDEFCNRLQ